MLASVSATYVDYRVGSANTHNRSRNQPLGHSETTSKNNSVVRLLTVTVKLVSVLTKWPKHISNVLMVLQAKY